MAYSSYRMIVHAAGSTRTAMMAGAAICVAPTLLVNAFIWGQADVIYTCFLVLFVHLAMRGHSLTAMVMFGVALSFKLQAMFMSPLILYLVLSRQLRIWHAALIPVAFGLMMLPAYLAGRSGWELIRIYLDQAETLELLAVFAPNAWFLVDLFNLVPYSTGVIIGFCTSFLAALAIALLSLRLPRGAVTILSVAAICAATMPFLLPKTHDRYFFVADILTILVALSMSRLWAVPFLFQFGSLLAYLRYFELSEYGPAFGFVPISFGVVLLWSEFAKAQRGAPYSVGSELKEWLRHPLSRPADGTRAT
jgi:Gpi18-like mannosyltransferase